MRECFGWQFEKVFFVVLRELAQMPKPPACGHVLNSGLGTRFAKTSAHAVETQGTEVLGRGGAQNILKTIVELAATRPDTTADFQDGGRLVGVGHHDFTSFVDHALAPCQGVQIRRVDRRRKSLDPFEQKVVAQPIEAGRVGKILRQCQCMLQHFQVCMVEDMQ